MAGSPLGFSSTTLCDFLFFFVLLWFVLALWSVLLNLPSWLHCYICSVWLCFLFGGGDQVKGIGRGAWEGAEKASPISHCAEDAS